MQFKQLTQIKAKTWSIALSYHSEQEAKLSLRQPTVLPHSRLSIVISVCCISSCFRGIKPWAYWGHDPWPFRVMWRHRPSGHSIPHRPFPVCFFRHFFGRLVASYSHNAHRRQTDDRRTKHCSISATVKNGTASAVGLLTHWWRRPW